MSKEKESHNRSLTKWIIGSAIAVILVIASLFAVDQYFEYKIERTVKSDAVIKILQSYVRPSMIFDQNETISSDQGALKLIEEYKVSLDNQGFVKTITISPKEPNTFPLITPLDRTVNYSLNIVRGKKFDVIYQLEVMNYTKPRAASSLFSLEMITGVSMINLIPKVSSEEKVTTFNTNIEADEFRSRKNPGYVRFSVTMGQDPAYQPTDGDTYFDTRKQYYRVFSRNKWRKLPLVDEQ